MANIHGIQATIDSPVEKAMGGAGDTLTGIFAAIISYGMEIFEHIPRAFAEILPKDKGIREHIRG